ncbi:MAG: PAS domain S-box protein [Candidatus Methanofastidiosa archaeon]|nr:PAS domain S-box protein [Candidatus Methanofastidiosa archaeon]
MSEYSYLFLKDLENLIVITLAKDGNVTQINQTGCKILGYMEEEIIGKNWFEHFLPENNRAATLQTFNDLISGRCGVSYYENPILTKDGRQRRIAWNNVVLKDDQGNIVGILDSGFDITEHIETKDMLLEKERSLEEALKESRRHEREVIAFLNGTRAVLECRSLESASKSILHSCMELTGSKSGYISLLKRNGDENEVVFVDAGGPTCNLDLGRPMPIRGFRSDVYKMNKASYDNDFANSGRTRCLPDGHIMLKNVLLAPIQMDGQPKGLLGLANKGGDFNDDDLRIAMGFGELVTMALKNQHFTDKLIAQRKELSDYSQYVSHDIKNYIAILEEYYEMFSNGIMEKEEFLSRNIRLLDKMKSFVSAQLSLAESGKSLGTIEEIELNHLIDEISKNFNIEISRGDLGTIKGDKRRIEEALMNIFNNSIRHGGSSRIDITRSDADGQISLVISDNGKGLEEGEINKIFDIGYSTSGSGFGLSIVKRIMEAHGGCIRASSQKDSGMMITLSFDVSHQY